MLSSAAGADFEMAAEGSRAAPADGRQDSLLGAGEEVLPLQFQPVEPDDISDVMAWARMAHGFTG